RTPVVYQEVAGQRRAVAARYRQAGAGDMGLALGRYDHDKPLVVDPVVLYATYLGGSTGEAAYGVAVDGAGAMYLAGNTGSVDYPTVNAYQSTLKGTNGCFGVACVDAVLSKLSPDGHTLLYSTYFGGNGSETGNALRVDAAGDAYIVGTTQSSDLPVPGGYQTTYGGGGCFPPIGNGDAYLVKFSPSGTRLLYATYFGGCRNDGAYGLAIDNAGRAYLAGDTTSTNLPTKNADQAASGGGDDAFVAAFDTTQAGAASLVYATYLGGSGNDVATDIAVDGAGVAYVTGNTNSSNFPTTAGAYQPAHAGQSGYYDMFLARLRGAGFTPGTVPWHPHSVGGGLGRIGNGIDLSVDLADGHADVGLSDLSIPGRGPDLALQRTWDSLLAQTGGATATVSGLASSLTPAMSGVLTGTVVYSDSSGAAWDFVYGGGASDAGPFTNYRTPPGQPWQLTTSTAGYTLTNFLTSEVWTFDAQGRLLADTDSYGNQNTMSYGAGSATSPASAANSGGRSLSLGYTGGLLTEAQSPLWQSGGAGAAGSQHVAYGYNAAGQLTTRTLGAGTPDAVATTFGYSGTLMTSITTAANRAWGLGYDGQGRVISVTAPASGTVGQPGYTPSYTTQYSYGVTQTAVVAGAGTGAALTTTYTLDAAGEAITTTDGLGHSSGASYDADHDVTASQDANGNVTTNKYQYIGSNGAIGQVIEEDQPAIEPYVPGNSPVTPVSTHTYDPATHDLVATKLPEGGLTMYSYDGHHSVVGTAEQTTCPGCATTWQGTIDSYDAYGERTSATDGRGVNATNGAPMLNGQASAYTSHMGYDPQGDLTSESTPPITTTLGGVTTTASAVTTSYTYDGDGNRQTLVSANGNTTSYGYDHLGRTTAMT
ncbi:MAG: SBBP repeat-containing protein, partial [Chloroflexota bacterium]|nr:SBBP repeat-containing protein [Chloroflexota bacterium]